MPTRSWCSPTLSISTTSTSPPIAPTNSIIFGIQDFFNGNPESRAFVTGNLINFDADDIPPLERFTFIHEMTHVWQNQNVGPIYMASCDLRPDRQGDAAYNYGYDDSNTGITLPNGNYDGSTQDEPSGHHRPAQEARTRSTPTDDFIDFNPEQQGQIMMHYFVRRAAQPDRSDARAVAKVRRPSSRATRRLPETARLCCSRCRANSSPTSASCWRPGASVASCVEIVACDAGLPEPQALLLQAAAPVDALLLAGSGRVRATSGAARARCCAIAWPAAAGRLAAAQGERCQPALCRDRGARARRAAQQVSVALLGQWHPQYLHVADRIEALLADRLRLLRWTGEAIGRDALVPALATGLGLGLYVGHGRPVGWVGYHGVRGRHFDRVSTDGARPSRSVRCCRLCCRTASRRRVGLSYAEQLPLPGVAAAASARSATRCTPTTRAGRSACATRCSAARAPSAN